MCFIAEADQTYDDHNLISYLGQKLCDLDEETECGDGTYERNGAIYSTLVGYAEITESSDDTNKVSSTDYTLRLQSI